MNATVAQRTAHDIRQDMGIASRDISDAMFMARERKYIGQDVQHWVSMAREASRQYVRLLAELKATGEYVDWGAILLRCTEAVGDRRVPAQ